METESRKILFIFKLRQDQHYLITNKCFSLRVVTKFESAAGAQTFRETIKQ